MITSDNGSEFVDLSNLEVYTDTDVHFTHPYSYFEKGTNERYNGLIRRFITKRKPMSNYDSTSIAFIEEWMNTLPIRTLGYNTPKDLFESHLGVIYLICYCNWSC
jgi:Transposase and inactivated derivatives, IS30 family